MRQPLTHAVLGELLADLHAAFPASLAKRNPEHTADVYSKGLNGMSADAVRWAVVRSIEEDEYFPKVSRLRSLAQEWLRRNTMAFAPRHSGDPMECSVCGARAQQVPITRYRRKWEGDPPRDRYVLDLDADGNPVVESLVSVGFVMTHDRNRHGVNQRSESEDVA